MEHKTGLEDYYVIRGQKKMRFGYTTGSCAAAACKGACLMLLGKEKLTSVPLMTPKGILLDLELHDIQISENQVTCAVKKDAGDDPDTTNGILVYATVWKTDTAGIVIDGGVGVGRVTRPGLSQKVGEAAINPVPRAMILREAEEAAVSHDYEGGLKVVISVPEGVEIGKKTFNPRLGITGGISILGTSGIVEPMSEKALVESIHVEMKQHFTQGEKYLLVTPGNYGADYLREHMTLPFERNMNTHSHSADARMEVLAANALRVGADGDTARAILNCNTTDDALDVLHEKGLLEPAMKEIMEKIQFYLDHRSYEQIKLGAVVFNNVYGYLGKTRDAGELIQEIQKQDKMLKLQI